MAVMSYDWEGNITSGRDQDQCRAFCSTYEYLTTFTFTVTLPAGHVL